MNHIFRNSAGYVALILFLLPGASRAATVSLTPNTAQSLPAPASPGFGITISIQQQTDAYGNTAQDWLRSYKVERQGSLRASGGIPPYSDTFQATFSESDALSAGVHTYWVTAIGDAPEPYDRWVEGYEEEDGYWDEMGYWVVDGSHWVDGHREAGFDWRWNTDIGGEQARFFVGNAAPGIVSPPQPAVVTLGTEARFGAVVSAGEHSIKWQRLPAAGGTWADVVLAGPYRASQPGGWGSNASMLHVVVTSLAMNGDQFRCVVTNPGGSTASASATLTVNRAFFSGDQEVAVSYLTPQQTAGPASVSFSVVFTGRTYTAANGETASDQLSSYSVLRADGTAQTYPLNYNAHHVPGAPENVYQATHSEYPTLAPGVYTYRVTLGAWHPEPFDRWEEGHYEDEHDNPDDPGEVTGQHWVDAHGEIGFDWVNTGIGDATVPFYIGVAPPAPNAPPTYSLQPTSKVVVAGAAGAVTFSASAVSETLADLKWQRRTVASGAWVDLAPDSTYSVATANNRATLAISAASAAMNGDQFRCIAGNAAGSTASDSATLTVHSAPTFVTQPANRGGAANTTVNVSFTATASGTPAPTYRWQRLGDQNAWVDLGNNAPYSGADTPTLTFNGYFTVPFTFRCLATNVVGTAISPTAVLEVLFPPTFTSQPAHRMIDEGNVANFNVSVNGTLPMSYLWRV